MSNRLLLVLSALLLLASQANLAWMVAPLQPSILALQFAFKPQAYWRIIDLWGASGLALYRAHFSFDAVHPFIYGAFGYLLITRTSLFDGSRLRSAGMLALPLAALLDLAENAAQLFLLGQAHGLDSIVIPISATCSLLKWGLVGAFVVVVGVRWGRRRRR